MRLLILLLSVLLLGSVIGFVMTNLEATTEVTLWSKHYEAVPIHWVILSSLLAGIVYVGIIAVAEGFNLRLSNRRLTREVQRLETELNYLRTEPARASGSLAAETGIDDALAEPEEEPSAYDRAALPSAPVYGSDDDEGESDDEFYSGGRAV